MSKASKQIENEEFADRLRQALKAAGIRPSATVLANEFNLRYWGESITINTARNWLTGKSIPMQDKLRVLADWLHVSADELRFGSAVPLKGLADLAVNASSLSMQDREMIKHYLALPAAGRKTVCDVVAALSVAAGKAK